MNVSPTEYSKFCAFMRHPIRRDIIKCLIEKGAFSEETAYETRFITDWVGRGNPTHYHLVELRFQRIILFKRDSSASNRFSYYVPSSTVEMFKEVCNAVDKQTQTLLF